MAKKKSGSPGAAKGSGRGEKKGTRKGRSRAKGSGAKRGASKRRTAADRRMETLRRWVRNDGVRFLDDPNITSVGIGYKICDGERTDILSIQFTVAEKPEEGVSLESLDLDTEPIPKALTIAGEEFPTDVIERSFEPGYVLVAAEETDPRKRRLDPLVPGISVSHPSGTAGTLGLVVFDAQTGDPCMLSNWHVLHRGAGAVGDAVVQPGPHDDNDLQLNHAGRLVRSHLGPAGDCAIARIESRAFNRTILDLGVVPDRIARAELGDRVVKSGRTTAVTRGVVRRVDVMARINYAGVGPQDIGGFEIGPEESAAPTDEISLGGDSGSAWLIAGDDGAPTTILAGLHFAGEATGNPDEHALACYAHSVFKKLDISLEGAVLDPVQPDLFGLGYDRAFLTEEVTAPELNSAQRADAFLLDGSPLLPYAHFSVCLSKERGLPRFVAWNIDGSRILRLSRDGIPFLLDPRVDEAFQHGNELYVSNPLDRGHVARRADLTWGSALEAGRANRDSFFYTNITPQHASFNQSSRSGLWGLLENAVFADVEVEHLRISVLGGPVFRDDDRVHRGVKIPSDYWKLVAYRDTADGTFKARAFVLTQQDLLSDIEALELDPFRIFQVSLAKLAELTGLGFSGLQPFDTFASDIEVEELAPRRSRKRAREVSSREDLLF